VKQNVILARRAEPKPRPVVVQPTSQPEPQLEPEPTGPQLVPQLVLDVELEPEPEPAPLPRFIPISSTHLPISVVIPTWGQPTAILKRTIHTLVNQSLPPLEIIIVDGGPNGKHKVGNLNGGIVRVIRAHTPDLNLAHLFNIGIRRARGEYILTTGNDRLFSRDFLQVASSKMSHQCMLGATWGMLVQNADLSGDIFSRWDDILNYVKAGSTGKVNPGTFQIVAKDWWMKVRGYDETMPYHYIDSDVMKRAIDSGLHWPGVSWDEAQVLHQWHPAPNLKGVKVVTLADLYAKTGIARNPSTWGALPDDSPLGISFVFTWKERDIRYLRCCIHSLSNQTILPVEIVVTDQEVDSNPDTVALCNRYPLCTYIHAPNPTFNLSWGFNVGIKRTVGDFVITTGGEFVFAENYVETIQPLLSPGIWLDSENTPLAKRATMVMLDHPDPNTSLYWGQPFTKFPDGLHVAGFFGATRKWLEKAHGWNEELPFACSDADIWQRAEADGLRKVFVGHDKTQIFHLWHKQSEYLDLDKKYFKMWPASPIVCNPDGWGELDGD